MKRALFALAIFSAATVQSFALTQFSLRLHSASNANMTAATYADSQAYVTERARFRDPVYFGATTWWTNGWTTNWDAGEDPKYLNIFFNRLTNYYQPANLTRTTTNAPGEEHFTNLWTYYGNDLRVEFDKPDSAIRWHLVSWPAEYTNSSQYFANPGGGWTNAVTLTPLPTGTYVIACDTAVRGYSIPASQSVAIDGSAYDWGVTNVYRAYSNSVAVTIVGYPAGNCSWTVSGPAEYTNAVGYSLGQTNDTTLANVPTGVYTFGWPGVVGWITPTGTVEVTTATNLNAVTATYVLAYPTNVPIGGGIQKFYQRSYFLTNVFLHDSGTPLHQRILNLSPDLSALSNAIPDLSGLSNAIPDLSGLSNSIPDLSGLSNSIPDLSGLSNAIPDLAGISNTLGTAIQPGDLAPLSNAVAGALTVSALVDLSNTVGTALQPASLVDLSNTVGTAIQPGDLASLSNAIPDLSGLSNAVPDLSGLSNAIPNLAGLSNAIPDLSGLSNAIPDLSSLSNSMGGATGVIGGTVWGYDIPTRTLTVATNGGGGTGDASLWYTYPALTPITYDVEGDSGAKSATYAGNADDQWSDWATPTNAILADEQYAVAIGSNTASDKLMLSGFGFAVPQDATVTNLAVTIIGHSDTETMAYIVELATNAPNYGLLAVDNLPLPSVNIGPSPLTTNVLNIPIGSGAAWTNLPPDMVNNTNFGFGIDIANCYTASVDYVSLQVQYAQTNRWKSGPGSTGYELTFDGSTRLSVSTGGTVTATGDVIGNGVSLADTLARAVAGSNAAALNTANLSVVSNIALTASNAAAGVRSDYDFTSNVVTVLKGQFDGSSNVFRGVVAWPSTNGAVWQSGGAVAFDSERDPFGKYTPATGWVIPWGAGYYRADFSAHISGAEGLGPQVKVNCYGTAVSTYMVSRTMLGPSVTLCTGSRVFYVGADVTGILWTANAVTAFTNTVATETNSFWSLEYVGQ